MLQNTTIVSGVLDIYAKANTARYLILVHGAYASGDLAIYDLVGGTVTQQPTFSGSTASMTLVNNGYYRCFLNSAQTTPVNGIIGFSVSGAATGLTTGTSGNLYIYGSQFENLSFSTSYIPTTSAQVTRAADVKGGLSTSGWYNNGPGTFYMDMKTIYSNSTSPATTLICNNNITTILYTNNTGNGIYSYDNVSASSQGSIPFGTRLQLAISYGVAGKQLLYNGGAVATSTYNNAFANSTTLYFGNSNVSNGQINGWIRKMAYYPQQLTVAQTQALTGS
jgi:hypothetical protein